MSEIKGPFECPACGAIEYAVAFDDVSIYGESKMFTCFQCKACGHTKSKHWDPILSGKSVIKSLGNIGSLVDENRDGGVIHVTIGRPYRYAIVGDDDESIVYGEDDDIHELNCESEADAILWLVGAKP